MSTPRNLLASTVGTKVVLATTGLLLVGFLVAHLLGNLTILAGSDLFNRYSEQLTANKPLLYAMEIGLVAIYLVHVVTAVRNWAKNRAARPVAYANKSWAGGASRKSIASTTMIASGAFVFVFVILHLKTFKWGAWYVTETGIRDLARLEREIFSNPLYVAFYVLSMVIVGLHLRHGFSSAFQSLGADHPRTTPWLLRAGVVVAAALALGFALIPIAVYLGGR